MAGRKGESTLRNIGTSEVFYILTQGITTPKGIADYLDLDPPPVMQQLHRLKKAKLVKLGKKEGKYQHYEIDLEGLTNLFLNESTKNLHDAITLPFIYQTDEMLQTQLSQPEYGDMLTDGKKLTREEMFSLFKKKLGKNKSWERYLFAYVRHLGTAISLGVTPLSEAIRYFEAHLRVEIHGEIRKLDATNSWNLLDESTRELLKLLHIWVLLILKAQPLQEAAHREAVREVIGPQLYDKIGEDEGGQKP